MPHYVYIWEYDVRPENVAEFETAYGPSGTWAQLFCLADGYLRTELIRDPNQTNRYITIDHWKSRGHWERFRADFSDEFEKIDARCEALTESEREIGQFDAVDPAA